MEWLFTVGSFKMVKNKLYYGVLVIYQKAILRGFIIYQKARPHRLSLLFTRI